MDSSKMTVVSPKAVPSPESPPERLTPAARFSLRPFTSSLPLTFSPSLRTKRWTRSPAARSFASAAPAQ